MLLLLCLGVEHRRARPRAAAAHGDTCGHGAVGEPPGPEDQGQAHAGAGARCSLSIAPATGWLFKRAARCSPRSRAPPAAPRSPAALAPQIAERKALAERAGAFLKDLSGKLGARPAAAVCGVLVGGTAL